MRILVDLKSHLTATPLVVQVEKVPPVGSAGATAVNGKYLLPIAPGADFPIDSTSYVLDGAGNIDGGDISSIAFAHLLAAFPQYANIYFNPLLTSDHVSELVLDQSSQFIDGNDIFFPRFQTGREEGVDDDGQMPTHTALLPANTAVTPTRPGLIITDEIDIGAHTLDGDSLPVGADDFLVFWKLYAFTVTDDISADFGAQAGKNEPALRMVSEVVTEPADFSAYITTDDGATWTQVGLLEPVTFCDKKKNVRLAFRSDGAVDKVFIANYALLF